MLIHRPAKRSTPRTLPIETLLPGPAAADRLDLLELGLLTKAIANQPGLWATRMRRPDADRWWTRLHGDDRLDIWLLTWLPGHATELHDHGDSAAAFTVLQGQLEETRVMLTGGRAVIDRRSGVTARISSGVVHDVRAAIGDPAASIHAYSPPLRRMSYYSPGPDGRLRVERTIVSDQPEQESA